MGTKNLLKRKIHGIKYNYGIEEAQYFKKNPYCEICLEKRLVLLNIHHKKGRKVKEFQTLCFNCHMIVHNPKNAHETYESCLNYDSEFVNNKKDKHKKILNALQEGVAIRNIIRTLNTSKETVHKVMSKNGFVSKPRSGYFKI